MPKRNDIVWMERLEVCKRYVAEHDGNMPSHAVVVDGFPLGVWFNSQDSALNGGVMPETRKALWVDFVANVKRLPACSARDDARWMEHFETYKRYVEENCRFPGSPAVYEGFKVGAWLHNQYHAWKNENLPDNRRMMLDEFHPAWRAPLQEKKNAEKEMAIRFDCRRMVPVGDVPLDKVLGGVALDVCVTHGIFGCRQYLEMFYKMRNLDYGAFGLANEGFRALKRFGAGVFSLENRKAAFEALYPRVSFHGFNLVCAVDMYWEAGDYLQEADYYNRHSRFGSGAEMDAVVRKLLDELPGSEGHVLYQRFYEGSTLVQIAEEMSRTRARLHQIERLGLRKLRHPVRWKEITPLTDIELMRMGRGADVYDGVCLKADEKWAGGFDLSGSACCVLPKGLTVEGFLDLRDTPLEVLPEGLYVKGDLLLEGTQVQEVPGDLHVEGSLWLPVGVQEVPETVWVCGEILQGFEEMMERDDAMRGVEELGLSREVVEVLKGNGVYTKMDLMDLEREKPFGEILLDAQKRADNCKGESEPEGERERLF